MQPGDAATWASVVAAYWVGGAGTAVGIAGLVIALFARKDSKKANLIAEKANLLAENANVHADEAVTVAKASIESSNARWELVWTEPGKATLFNRGLDVAHEVRGEVIVDDETRTFGPVAAIARDEGHGFDFPAAAEALGAAESHRKEAAAMTFLISTSDYEDVHAVRWNLVWKGPLGRTFHSTNDVADQRVTPGAKTEGAAA